MQIVTSSTQVWATRRGSSASVTARRWSSTRPGSPTASGPSPPNGVGRSRGRPTPTRMPTTSRAAPSSQPRGDVPRPRRVPVSRCLTAGRGRRAGRARTRRPAAGPRNARSHARAPRLPPARWTHRPWPCSREDPSWSARGPHRPHRRRPDRGTGPAACGDRSTSGSSRCPTICPSTRLTARGRSAPLPPAADRRPRSAREQRANPLLAIATRTRSSRQLLGGLGTYPAVLPAPARA